MSATCPQCGTAVPWEDCLDVGHVLRCPWCHRQLRVETIAPLGFVLVGERDGPSPDDGNRGIRPSRGKGRAKTE
jgi:hypothetical protein